jgi:hypothetical protein
LQSERDSIVLEPPDGWSMRRVDVLTGDPPPDVTSGWRPTITVAREASRPGETLDAHVFRTLLERATIVPGRSLNPSLVHTKRVEVAGRRATRTSVTWEERAGRRNQELVHVESPEGDVIIVAGPTFPPSSEREAEWLDFFERTLTTASFEQAPSTERAPSSPAIAPHAVTPAPPPPSAGPPAATDYDFAAFPAPGTRRRTHEPT